MTNIGQPKIGSIYEKSKNKSAVYLIEF